MSVIMIRCAQFMSIYQENANIYAFMGSNDYFEARIIIGF
jgi:hypothetical protein